MDLLSDERAQQILAQAACAAPALKQLVHASSVRKLS
jgi:hypothetical protein